MARDIIIIYTDGGCSPNPGKGAWASLVRYKGMDQLLTGFTEYTTNNRMEVMAVLEGLRRCTGGYHIHIVTDSRYTINGIKRLTKDLKKKQDTFKKYFKSNYDLWEEMKKEIPRHKCITHIWVRGHSGHPENTYVDGEVGKILRGMK